MALTKSIIIGPESFPPKADVQRPSGQTGIDTPYGMKALGAECDRVAKAPVGTRNDTLNKACFNVFQLVNSGHLSEQTAMDRLWDAGLQCGLPGAEIKATIRSARTGAQRSPRLTVPDPTEPMPTPVVESWDGTEAVQDGLLQGIKSGTWLDEQVFQTLQWVVEGIVSEGYGLLAGPPKVGKSWLVLALALAGASGGTFLSIPVRKRPVLYLALEDGDRRMQDRCRTLLAGQGIPSGFNYATSAKPEDILPIVAAWLDRNPDGLVLLDTLGKVMPRALPGENDYQRDYRVGGNLKGIVDQHSGSTLLVVHHTRKATTIDWLESASGTFGLAGAADFIIGLSRARGEASATLRVTGRDIIEGEYAVTFDGGAWALTGETLSDAQRQASQGRVIAGLGDDSAKVVAFIDGHPEGVRRTAVARHMGWSDDKASTYLTRLAEAGRIVKPSRGLYAPVCCVVSVCSQSPELTLTTQHTHHMGDPFAKAGEVEFGEVDLLTNGEGDRP